MEKLKWGFRLNALAGVLVIIAATYRSPMHENWLTWYPMGIFFLALATLYYVRWKRS